MELEGFDLSGALAAADGMTELKKFEREMRVLGAAEFATSTVSEADVQRPISVTEEHWDWVCKNYLCPTGEWPKCNEMEGPRLSEVTVLAGYVRKLDALGYSSAEEFADNFDAAISQLECMLNSYAHGSQVVDSGAFELQVSTWRARLKLLGLL